MKNFSILLIGLLLFVCARGQIEKAIPNKPNPPRLVNDYAEILTPDQEQALEAKLVKYDDSTSNQVAVVTVKSLEGYSADEYAVALGRDWGVGGKEFNNGVVILVSAGGGEGNRDAFIAPGYGLEGKITDLTAKSIVDEFLIPNLKLGNYYRAFDQAIDAIIKAAAGEYKAPPGYGKKDKGISLGRILFFIILLWIILGIFGGRGRGGGGMMSRRGYRGWLGPMMFPTGGGLSGGGGGWSGGGGGGFGGFGGGGFGGGGAGGKW